MSDHTTASDSPAQNRRESVEYFVQCQQPDGTWEQCSSTTSDPKFAGERISARRRMQPEFTYRIAQRTTTVTVRALPDCFTCKHWICDGRGPCRALVSVSAVNEQRCGCPGPTTP